MTGLLAWLDRRCTSMWTLGQATRRRDCDGCRRDVGNVLCCVTGYARVVSPAGVA